MFAAIAIIILIGYIAFVVLFIRSFPRLAPHFRIIPGK
jgi:hypothetical protein